MRSLQAIRVAKTVIEEGSWQNGKIPVADFPLSHVKRHHKLSRGWQWCILRAVAESQEYRILVALEPSKSQYWAWLAAIYGSDQAVLARVEFHASHDGWHCHWKAARMGDVPKGAVKAAFPIERRRDCGSEPLALSKANARGIADRLFNLSMATPEGRLL